MLRLPLVTRHGFATQAIARSHLNDDRYLKSNILGSYPDISN
jgi:hypothetical protein